MVESGAAAILPGTLLEDRKNKASLSAHGDVVEQPAMSMKELIIALQRLLREPQLIKNTPVTADWKVRRTGLLAPAPVYTLAEESLKHL